MNNAAAITIDPLSAGVNNAALSLALPEGDAGTDLTIITMTAMVHDARENSERVQVAAERLAHPSPWHRWLKLYWWLRQVQRFQRDPGQVEHVRHPDVILEEIRSTGFFHGDCDDLAVLGAAVLAAFGDKPALIVVGRTAGRPFEHVFYGAVNPGGRVTPFDPQEQTPPGNWPRGARTKVYKL